MAISSLHSEIAVETTCSVARCFRETIFSQIIVSRSSLSEIFILWMKSRLDSALRASPVICSGFFTGTQPRQIPLDGVRPLIELPGFTLAVIPLYFRPPERLRGISAGFHLMAQPEILEPFQNEQKPRPLLLRESTEL